MQAAERSIPKHPSCARAAVLGILLLLGGCGTDRLVTQDRRARAATERICAQPGNSMPAPRQWRGEAQRDPLQARITLAQGGFSASAIGAAEAIGADGLLLRLAALGGGPGTSARMAEALQVRLELTEAIMLGILDVASTLAEIDCEGERGDQLRTRLQAALDRRLYRLNIATILTGAATAAATGTLAFVSTAAASNIAGIVGGNAEAGLGLALLFGEVSGELRTPRNMLREVWDRPAESRLMPASVWRYLNRADLAGVTQLDRLIAEWCIQELLGEPGSEAERERGALFLGMGGSYTPGDLDIREAMMELLQASVAMMNQDLRNLLAEVARWWAESHRP
ncbi:MAG: hypothetical protein EON47_00045 [Acetobacteraceae bacterium]|nr:MAG: hypothetical protein EON47_00045 [Acetobacteraceae bacterium]